MEKKYTAEDGLKLFDIANISLPLSEIELFKSQFDKIYGSSPRYKDLVGTVWEIYSQILPFKAHSGEDNQINYYNHLAREEEFHEKVIKSGLDKKLKQGISIKELEELLNSNNSSSQT